MVHFTDTALWCRALRATGPPRGSATNLAAERRGRSDMLIQPGSGKIYHMKSYVHGRCNVMYTIYLIYCVCVYIERYIYRVMVIQVNTLCEMCTGVLYEGKHRFIPISVFPQNQSDSKASNHGLCMSSSKTMVPPKKETSSLSIRMNYHGWGISSFERQIQNKSHPKLFVHIPWYSQDIPSMNLISPP